MKAGKANGVKSTYILLFLSLTLVYSFVADTNRLSAHMESQRLTNGKVIKITADIYFKYNENALTIHYTYPNDYVLMTNSKGEVKAYNSQKNEVTVMQNSIFSSENDMLYLFLANKQNDLGLTEAGFMLTNSTIKDKMQITTWLPPAQKATELSKIELVHENYLPINTAYYDVKDKVFKKVYYSNYLFTTFSPLPQKIVEIDYPPKGDSIVSRKIYSDIKTGNQCSSTYFEFSIPANAKISKVK